MQFLKRLVWILVLGKARMEAVRPIRRLIASSRPDMVVAWTRVEVVRSNHTLDII